MYIYHIFYLFFLKGAEGELLKELYLERDIKKYDYICHDKTKDQVNDVLSINDIDFFKSTNFSDEENKEIFKVMSPVILIGNIKFKVDNKICTLENKDIYENIFKLLKLNLKHY